MDILKSELLKINFNNVKAPKFTATGGGAASALLKISIVGGLAAYGTANSLYKVEGGHRAIVFNRIVGIKDKVYCEGIHIMIPWVERPIIYDVRARPHLVEITSGSCDLHMVKIALQVLARPMPDKLPTIYRTLGVNYDERVLPSIIDESLEAVIAQYSVSQLITQRETFGQEIQKMLTERASHFSIALDDVSITSLIFGKEFTDAIDAKQVAAEEAERAKFLVEKAEQYKRRTIIRAQREAKSAQLIGELFRQFQILRTRST